jgi:hypothetical protein
MERVVAGRAFTLSKTFYSDGAAVAPTGAPTLTLTRVSDGTTVPTSVVTGTGTGPFQVTVTAANNLLLDTLTATWTATITAQASTYVDTVEVAGGTICTLAELGSVLSGLTASQLADKRTAIEQRLEKELGYAVVPRYALETRRARDGVVSTRLPLRAVRSISTTAAGVTTPYSAAQLSALTLESWGVCGVWVRGPVTIGYEHGEDFPDSDIAEAALLLADEAYGSAVDGRVVRQEADNMAVTYASPSSNGPFIGARLNQIIRANRMPSIA